MIFYWNYNFTLLFLSKVNWKKCAVKNAKIETALAVLFICHYRCSYDFDSENQLRSLKGLCMQAVYTRHRTINNGLDCKLSGYMSTYHVSLVSLIILVLQLVNYTALCTKILYCYSNILMNLNIKVTL